MSDSARYVRLSLVVLPLLAFMATGAQCLSEISPTGGRCGDGNRDIFEQCDGNEFESLAPVTHGPCRNDCTYCGNGVVDGPAGVETCDDGDAINANGCRNDCTFCESTESDCDDTIDNDCDGDTDCDDSECAPPAATCGNGAANTCEECGETGLPACPAGTTCVGCVCQ